MISQNFQEQLFKESLQFQDILSKEGVRRKVDDTVEAAKKHGFHPYALLGTNTYNAPSAFVPGGALGRGVGRAGQNIGGAVNRLLDPTGRRNRKLQNDLLEAQIGHVKAKTADLAKASTLVDPFIMNELYGGVPEGRVTVGPLKEVKRGTADFEGLIEVEPTKQKTGKKGTKGIISGLHKGFREYELPNGMPILLPDSDEGLSEILQNLDLLEWYTVAQINANAYGGHYMTDLKDFALGAKRPKHYYMAQTKHGPRKKRKPIQFETLNEARDFIGKIVDRLNSILK